MASTASRNAATAYLLQLIITVGDRCPKVEGTQTTKAERSSESVPSLLSTAFAPCRPFVFCGSPAALRATDVDPSYHHVLLAAYASCEFQLHCERHRLRTQRDMGHPDLWRHVLIATVLTMAGRGVQSTRPRRKWQFPGSATSIRRAASAGMS
jgi:hypothetical protein